MKRLLSTTAIVVGAFWFGALVPAQATTISLTDSWSTSNASNVTGHGPSISNAAGQGTSNDGTVNPVANPYTQTYTVGTNTKVGWLFVASPTGSGLNSEDLKLTMTLTDGGTGTGTAVFYMDYNANFFTNSDDMAWFANPAASPGQFFGNSLCTGTNNGCLTQTVNLSDGAVVNVTLPFETDWDMAQSFSIDVLDAPTATPEPASMLLLGGGIVGLGLVRRHRV